MSKCKYGLAWVGQCKNDAVNGMYCEEHSGIVCKSCGKQATHQCEETSGLVCGAPLCNGCEHTICKNGTNSGELPEGMGDHCKKEDQVYIPWYRRHDYSIQEETGDKVSRVSRKMDFIEELEGDLDISRDDVLETLIDYVVSNATTLQIKDHFKRTMNGNNQ